ncbi:prabable sialidase [Lentisphaera araneosa HTCC2155]|jgi:hypothetical protein|uniref:Prabable sialidase n=1 Tax=Lentisphaera araneosa HTCC2155 TaxID=313628 RepID=A6DPU4_9BACT|nr:sialidase family protein [Lentisphaera araneosa]EDM26389.1 prabable sialidase [Lentisphaera araneosa HTCC2155]
MNYRHFCIGMVCLLFLMPTSVYCQQPYEPYLDFSKDTSKHVVIAAGTPTVYQGHPTSVLLADGKTMFCVWCQDHGGNCGPFALSKDAGKTWKRVDDRLPKEFRKSRNCPTIFRMRDMRGKERLFIFSQGNWNKEKRRYTELIRVMSEDQGNTWKMMPTIPLTAVMPFTTMIRLKDGSYLAQYNDRHWETGKLWNRIFQIKSSDGGITWGKSRCVAQSNKMNLCEPFLLRSPDGEEICSILRDNVGGALSKLIFSKDEGKSWSPMEESSWGLTGHRHHGVQLEDGRWIIAFRDRAPHSPSMNNFVAWIGTYDDIKNKLPGKRIKLLHSFQHSDCGYASLSLLPDKGIFAVTYIKYKPDRDKHSIVGVRLSHTDLK